MTGSGIPSLAGVCSYEEASRPGISIERSVGLLKRYNHALRRLNGIATAHLTSTPEWEVKCALALHLWLDAEHATAIRARVAELREPPLHLDAVPDETLEVVFAEAIRARTTGELLAAAYGVLRAELVAALHEHLAAMNPLFDHPTRRLLRAIVREQEEALAWGRAALEAVGDEAFAAHVRAYLAAAGGISGLNSRYAPLEAHLILWKIEQGLMPRTTGKRAEFELATEGGDELSIAMQDYDWADEVLHAQIGRRHLDKDDRARADEVWARYQAIVDEWAAEHADDEPWWDRFLADVRTARSG